MEINEDKQTLLFAPISSWLTGTVYRPIIPSTRANSKFHSSLKRNPNKPFLPIQ